MFITKQKRNCYQSIVGPKPLPLMGHPCPVCGKAFTRSRELQYHILVHTGEKPFNCKVCKKSFNHPSSLKSHKLIHERGKSYSCLQCGKQFTTNNEMKRHTHTAIEEQPCSCVQCGKEFKSNKELRRHAITHTARTNFCLKCDNTFKTIQGLRYHEGIHMLEKRYPCSWCKKVWYSYRSLEAHIKIHTRGKSYICSICDRTFSQLGALKYHQKKNNHKEFNDSTDHSSKTKTVSFSNIPMPSGEKPYTCLQCGKTLKSSGGLRYHKGIHMQGQQYNCSWCSKVWFSVQSLEAHIKTHTRGKPYICSFCKRSFSQRGAWRAHLQIHTGEKNFVCTICDKAFRQNQVLKQHKNKCNIKGVSKRTPFTSKHKVVPFRELTLSDKTGDKSIFNLLNIKSQQINSAGEEEFICLQCNNNFRTIKEIKYHHANIHMATGEKPKSFYQCAKFFRTNQGLYHSEMHKEDKQHPCPWCRKVSLSLRYLGEHIETHARVKPHSCSFCHKSFSLLGALKYHNNQAHNKTMAPTSDIVHYKEENHFECYICLRFSSQSPCLKSHKVTHTGERRFYCFLCGKKFRKKTEMNLHCLKYHQNKYNHNIGRKNKTLSSTTEIVPFGEVKTFDKICPVCGKFYNMKSRMAIHIRRHTGEKPFSCLVCGKQFSSLDSHKNHNWIHTEEKPFSCSYCEKSYPRMYDLKKHKNIFHKREKPFFDKYILKGAHSVSNKISRLTELSQAFNCLICNTAFRTNNELKRHKIIHRPKKLRHCLICLEVFSHSHQLKRHMKIHTEQRFSCSQCHKAFSGARRFGIHQKVHTTLDCSSCNKPFKYLYKLKRHQKTCAQRISERYSLERPLVCLYCDKRFKNDSSRKRHQRTHTKDEMLTSILEISLSGAKSNQQVTPTLEMTHCCSSCSMYFKDSYRLKRHQKTHSKDQLLTSLLDISLTGAQNLKIPERANVAEKSHCCSYCKKSFKYPYKLKRHQNIHEKDNSITVEKSLNCSSCNKTFKYPYKLKRHQNIHEKDNRITVEKSLNCSSCYKSFRGSYYLKRHQKTHDKEHWPHQKTNAKDQLLTSLLNISSLLSCTVEKSFTCSYCKKSFKDSYTLTRHHKIHEPQATPTIPTATSQESLSRIPLGSKPSPVSQPLNKPSPEQMRPTPPTKQTQRAPFLQQPKLSISMPVVTNLEKKCAICGSAFKQNYGLKRHMKVHTRNKEAMGQNTEIMKSMKCFCSGCSLRSCGICKSCKNKHLKQRCEMRRCIVRQI